MSLHWSEREGLEAQYGAFYVSLLLEVVRLFDDVESRRLMASEATAQAKARFCSLILEHDPGCRDRVTAYQERVRAEQAELTAQRAAYEERRVAAQRGEALRIEQAAADAARERYDAAIAAEKSLKEATLERIAREAEEQSRRDEEAQAAERRRVEEADKLLRLIEQKG